MDKMYYDLHIRYKDGEIIHRRALTYAELLMDLTFFINWHIKEHINIEEIVIE